MDFQGNEIFPLQIEEFNFSLIQPSMVMSETRRIPKRNMTETIKSDVQLVMDQTGCDEREAILALSIHPDLVDAIVFISKINE